MIWSWQCQQLVCVYLTIFCRREVTAIKMRTKREATGPIRWTFCCRRLALLSALETFGDFLFELTRMAEVSKNRPVTLYRDSLHLNKTREEQNSNKPHRRRNTNHSIVFSMWCQRDSIYIFIVDLLGFLVSPHLKQHLDQFSRFTVLRVVTNRRTQTDAGTSTHL